MQVGTYILLFFKAYRQVFEHLIEDFKTYRPLLSAIKNEYEMMLSAQREVIRQLEPLRASLKFAILPVQLQESFNDIKFFNVLIFLHAPTVLSKMCMK